VKRFPLQVEPAHVLCVPPSASLTDIRADGIVSFSAAETLRSVA